MMMIPISLDRIKRLTKCPDAPHIITEREADFIIKACTACIPFKSPQEDIKKLVGIYKLMLERMCESCQIHNPQHAPSGDYKGCTSCEEIEAYREVLALYREG